MFAGGRRRTSNIKVMQLFHELKQQFPTVPDHIVTACITSFVNPTLPNNVSDKDNVAYHKLLEAAAALQSVEVPMGRTLTKPTDPIVPFSEPSLDIIPTITEPSNYERNKIENQTTRIETRVPQNTTVTTERNRSEMNESVSDANRNVKQLNRRDNEAVIGSSAEGEKKTTPQRPNHLEIQRESTANFDKQIGEVDLSGFNRIQTSERCLDLQKLLNAENLNANKPPRSPLSAKRFLNSKNSPTKSDHLIKSPLTEPDGKKVPLHHHHHHHSSVSASASTSGVSSGGTNTGSSPLYFKSSDSFLRRPETAETPTQTTETLITGGSVNLSLNVNCQMDLVQSPTIPKHTSVLQLTPQLPWCHQEPMSQRSYTSVNLTLRPPSTEPQPPIDITSRNSSLTYSTSSFDSQKGLQSRLQITVGPGGGSVSSVRTRPRSSYHPQNINQETVPVRTGSLPDLAIESKPPVIYKQEACIERLRIELITEKGRLIAMQEEVSSLEKPNSLTSKMDAEIEKQLQKEIRHLRGQCERLTYNIDRQYESKVPLGETNEEFYRNIYTGQRGTFLSGTSINHSRHIHRRGSQSIPQIEVEGPKWNCHMCTFQNHPLLDKCEQCEMPRILHGTKPEPPNPCLAFGMVRPLGHNGPYSPNQVFNNINNNNNTSNHDTQSQNSNFNNNGSNLQSFNTNVVPLNYQQLTSQHTPQNSSSFL